MRIELSPYRHAWRRAFTLEARRIHFAIGTLALSIEHVGSTSVPGLAAKPVLDIQLAVPDSAREQAYRPWLEASGYALTVREPSWFEHRMFRRERPAVNLHVFSAGCEELARMILFRDWLRENPADRQLYAEAKARLAMREWTTVQQYADAKNEVIAQILARARAARGGERH